MKGHPITLYGIISFGLYDTVLHGIAWHGIKSQFGVLQRLVFHGKKCMVRFWKVHSPTCFNKLVHSVQPQSRFKSGPVGPPQLLTLRSLKLANFKVFNSEKNGVEILAELDGKNENF